MAEHNNQLHLDDLVHWLNEARLRPESLVPFLQGHLENFRNEFQVELAPNCYYKTHEGKGAWEEALEFLKAQIPLKPLVRHSGLNKSAEDHASDLARTFTVGSIGSDGSNVEKRIRRHCVFQQTPIGQTVAQELKKRARDLARETILSLIINDGNSSRTDRQSIFNAEFGYFGVSVKESTYSFVTVFNFSSHNLEQITRITPLGNSSNQAPATTSKQTTKKTVPKPFIDSENDPSIIQKTKLVNGGLGKRAEKIY